MLRMGKCLMNDSGIQSSYIRLLPHLRLTRIYPSELSLRLGIQGRNIDFFLRDFGQNLRVEINNKNGDLASRGLGSKAATTRSRDIGTGPGVDPQKLAVLVSTNLSGLRTPGPATDGNRASGLRGNCDCFAGSGGNTEFDDNHPTCEAGVELASGGSGLRTAVRRESGQTPGVSTHVCMAGYRRTFVLCRAHDSGDRGALPLVSYMSVRTERCSSFPVTFCLILFSQFFLLYPVDMYIGCSGSVL